MEKHSEKHTEHHSAKKGDTITLEKATVWKIATAVLAIVVIVMFLNKGGATVPSAPSPQPTAGGDQFPTVNVNMKALADDDAYLGDANAPLTIVEFSDFQCPFCKRFFTDTEAQLINTYVKTGKARLVYRDFPLGFHVNAQIASEGSECAKKQGKFWEMHDAIFKASQADGTGIASADLKNIAVSLGLDATKFNTCLDSGETSSEVQKDLADGQAAGVQGTPSFFIGKTDGSSAQMIAGAYPFSAFQQIIGAQG